MVSGSGMLLVVILLLLIVVAVDGGVLGFLQNHNESTTFRYNNPWNVAATRTQTTTMTMTTRTTATDRRENTKYWNIRRKNKNHRSLVGDDGHAVMPTSLLPTPTIPLRSSVVADESKKRSKKGSKIVPSIVDSSYLSKGGRGSKNGGMVGMRGKGGMGATNGNGVGGMSTMGGMSGKGGGGVGMGGKGGMGGMGSKMGKGGRSGKCIDFQFRSVNQRRLQFDGDNCFPNALAVAHDDPQLSMFVYLMETAELDFIFDCAGPFTILAPVNCAFAALDPELLADLLLDSNHNELRQFLLYHILSGVMFASDFKVGTVETLSGDSITVSGNVPIMFNDAVPTTTDILSCNGIMHIIDDVLFPDDSPEFCAIFDFDGTSGGTDCSPNILEVARRNPSLSIILNLIDLAGLTEVFACRGPFTLLLPNDAAFANLKYAMFDALRNPYYVDTLRDVLLYHVLPGSFLSMDLQTGPMETLLSGAFVSVTLEPIMFDNASVVTADKVGCNGYLYVINTVLLERSTAPPTEIQNPKTIQPVTTAGPMNAPAVEMGTPTRAPFVGQTYVPTPPPSRSSPMNAPSTIAGATDAPSVKTGTSTIAPFTGQTDVPTPLPSSAATDVPPCGCTPIPTSDTTGTITPT